MSSLPSPLLRRLNTSPPTETPGNNPASSLSVKILKNNNSTSFENIGGSSPLSLSANNSSANSLSLPLKWRIGPRKQSSSQVDRDNASGSSVETISTNYNTSAVSSPKNVVLSPLQSRTQIRSISSSSAGPPKSAASPISNYEASRLYFKQAQRNSGGSSSNVNSTNITSPLSTPKSAAYNHSVHGSASSYSTLTGYDSKNYKPIPSPFLESSHSTSPLLSPVVLKKPSVPSLSSIIPKKIRTSLSSSEGGKSKRLKDKLLEMELNKNPYKRAPTPQQVIVPNAKAPDIGSPYNVKHERNNELESEVSRHRKQTNSYRQNIRGKSCTVCDEKLDKYLQMSPTDKEKPVDLRCGCFCHAVCLKSCVELEKERSANQASTKLNYNKVPLTEKAFPPCYKCGDNTRAIPKNQALAERLITWYATYEVKNGTLRSLSPVSTTAATPKKINLNVNTDRLVSPVFNPYQNVNSPSSTFNSVNYFERQAKPELVKSSNPYIQNTLNKSSESPLFSPSATECPTIKSPPLSQSPLVSPRSDEEHTPSKPRIPRLPEKPPHMAPQFQVQRPPPLPPNRDKSKPRKPLGNSSTFNNSVPMKKPVLPYDNYARAGSMSPPKRNSNMLKNQTAISTDLPYKGELATKKKSVHDLSYEILNQQSKPAVESPGLHSKSNITKLRKDQLIESRSRGSSFSAVSSVVSSASRSPSPGADEFDRLSRSNSLSSSVSMSTDNTDDHARLSLIKDTLVNHLIATLKGNSDIMIESLGEIRLADAMLISINSMEQSSFMKKEAYLFKANLLIVDLDNPSNPLVFKLDQANRFPKMEIISTSIIKLEFKSESVFMSVQESKNEVIQKWTVAFSDHDALFPPSFITGTLRHLIDTVSSSEEGQLFQHGSNSQSTLDVSRRSMRYSRSSTLSNRFSIRNFYTCPKVLFLFIANGKALGGKQRSMLINIIKTLKFKIDTIRVVSISENLTTYHVNENDSSIEYVLENLGLGEVAPLNFNNYISDYLIKAFGDEFKSHHSISMVVISPNIISNPPNIRIPIQRLFVQVGIVLKNKRNSNTATTTMAANNVVNVPIWDNVMEALCIGLNVNFDNDEPSSDDNSDLDSDDDDDDDFSDYELETAHLDNEEFAAERRNTNAMLLMRTPLQEEAEISDFEDEESALGFEVELEEEEEDSDVDSMVSDDSTKDQLLQLQHDGLLTDQSLLDKYGDGDGENDRGKPIDAMDEAYSESDESHSDNNSGFDSDDSTREQLLSLNQNELLAGLALEDEEEEKLTLDSANKLLDPIHFEEAEASFIHGKSSPSIPVPTADLYEPIRQVPGPLNRPLAKETLRVTFDESPEVTTPNLQTQFRLTTPVLSSKSPRWSSLFSGIDKEWESLNDTDKGYMRFSKWKTLSLNGPKSLQQGVDEIEEEKEENEEREGKERKKGNKGKEKIEP